MTPPGDAAEPWEPLTVVSSELIDPGPVSGLAALFDDGLPAPSPGDPLPPLWHWAALPRWNPSGLLSADGHPRRGDFLPPIDLPRRMFAGGTAVFHRPLHVGATTRVESEVASVERKNGRSGRLVIVGVATRLHDDRGRLAIEERQDLVYREAPGAQTSDGTAPDGTAPDRSEAASAVRLPGHPAPGHPLRRTAGGDWELRTDPSLLMRFSALTANAHRIHYDWPYATAQEGYPDLVVHGPLQVLALLETHRLDGGAPVLRLRHRGRAPLFVGQDARLRAEAGDGSIALGLHGPAADSAGPGSTVDLTTA